ncbi:helix-turn-helix domain-containing protein [Streptomyces longwoodensis]|uniref:hypothetical protein n=1 Tax=Streptomyces longwoodensis TaxID=68231 RepID=UPI002DD7BD81|nr:hypothetical protein [Streptomyces longwoodensis]WRY88783.1 helix-turn-helix domain-containing protein [Streptomyces longwoodensis]
MTAPATHRPTPLDLARRTPAPTPTEQPRRAPYEPRTLTAEEALQPGRLSHKERLRQMLQHGMRISRMQPEARLVALTLLGYANFQTGRVHPRWQPTVEQLAEATGLSTGQVLVQLEVLTSRGWLQEHVLNQGPRAGTPVPQLCIPAWVLEQLRARAHQIPPAS